MTRRIALVLFVIPLACAPPTAEEARWAERADAVTIIRDDWGVPHIFADTDANAVFGLMYAQAEDDFNRVETNFLNSMGRLAEAEGRGALYRDLRMKLYIDPADLKELYAQSPDWLKALMDGWADGLNYYLHGHPEVRPRVIDRFEPWMALSFSEGSIGGDIERISLRELEAFYRDPAALPSAAAAAALRTPLQSISHGGFQGHALSEGRLDPDGDEYPDGMPEPTGSNGFAIAPSRSATGNALLYINPHTSFFFRHEAHVVSDEGLNAYGALTWGQFFIYQGFNEGAGWMHTSSAVDNIDEYREAVFERDGKFYYAYEGEERPLQVERITVPYRDGAGTADTTFTVYRTHHGPVIRAADGAWITVRLMDDPMNALIQSYSRTKATNYEEYRATMLRHTNSSNNTVFADREGNIAYFHSNFIPRRSTAFDWSRPVDGSISATEWDGVLAIDESPNVLNPPNGWIQNTNNWPYSAAGPYSPRREDFAPYVDVRGENARGANALRVLEREETFTIESLTAAGFDPYLSAFDEMLPALTAAYDRDPQPDLEAPIKLLRTWDHTWGEESVETSLAVYWGEAINRSIEGNLCRIAFPELRSAAAAIPDGVLLQALREAVTRLGEDFGAWDTPWGQVNRFQRLTGDIRQPFSDQGPSIPVGFTSSCWGSLASFGARTYPGTVRRYGTSGNSFVATVEFGDSLRAVAVTAGGLNSDPASPHFNDQAERYAAGNLRPVYFYRSQLEGHTERTYRPGE